MLVELKAALEGKLWADLRSLLDLPWIWAWDRPLTGAEFNDALEALFETAVDLQLIVLAQHRLVRGPDTVRACASCTCCLMWGLAGSWEEHEVEFDLHFGYTRVESRPIAIEYLGLTAPTPEVVPFPTGELRRTGLEDAGPRLARTGHGRIRADARTEPRTPQRLVA